MRRIYWDSMLLIYLLDNHPKYSSRVRDLLEISYGREDRLFTSFMGLGEVMAGASKSPAPSTPLRIRQIIDEMGFSYLAFDGAAVETFSRLRSVHRVKSADAIHLSCAAAAGMDLFLTNDRALTRLHVAGIHFIQDFDTRLMTL